MLIRKGEIQKQPPEITDIVQGRFAGIIEYVFDGFFLHEFVSLDTVKLLEFLKKRSVVCQFRTDCYLFGRLPASDFIRAGGIVPVEGVPPPIRPAEEFSRERVSVRQIGYAKQ